jgi:uncharacterized cupredoxin-like copper-binding protein
MSMFYHIMGRTTPGQRGAIAMKAGPIAQFAVLAFAATMPLASQARAQHPHGHGAQAHRHHASFSAGEPGNPKRPARIVAVTMRDGDGKMAFEPDRIAVKRGEQIRFKLRNNGGLDHEFILATTQENLAHGEEMKKKPDMTHAEPGGRDRLAVQ